MPALIACHPLTFGAWGARCAVEQLRGLGIESLELPIVNAGELAAFGTEPLLTSDASESEIDAVKRLLSDFGLRVTSCDVTGANPVDDAGYETLRRKIEIAAAFGATRVVGSAGDPASAEQLASMTERLRAIGDLAARCGMIYCLQMEPGPCVDHRGMLETIEEVGHRNVRINFDPGNLLYYNRHVHSEIALAKTCHLVQHVHLQDSQGEYGRRYSPALGRGGMVDFFRMLDLLRTCAFEGPYSLTLHGIEGEPPPSLELIRERITDSLALLRRLGYFR